MALERDLIESLAERLDLAEQNRTAIAKITDDTPAMDLTDAYDVQLALRRRKEGRGDIVVGVKAGLTSVAKMRQMGVHEPVMGFLTDRGAVAERVPVRAADMIHPRVEAEIAFVLKHPLRGPGCHIGAVLAATECVLPAIEVIDSRFTGFGFDLRSTIADNTSAARYVVGGRSRPAMGLDLRNLGIVLEKNGEIVTTAAASAVLGHPAASVALLANMAAARGSELPAGCLILTGGATEAVPVLPGDVINVLYQHLGSLSVRFD